MDERGDIPLYLFAKEPSPGNVKTRMQPQLDSSECAKLAQMMLRQSVQKIDKYWPGRQVICAAPDRDANVFKLLAAEFDCERITQRDTDLGGRMSAVLSCAEHQEMPVAVMGSDVPQLDGGILVQAYRLLDSGQNVIGLAEDGGFYLLGCQQFNDGLFDGIDWGKEEVSKRLLSNAEELDVSLERLPIMRDIDRFDDLIWLATQDSAYAELVGHLEL